MSTDLSLFVSTDLSLFVIISFLMSINLGSECLVISTYVNLGSLFFILFIPFFLICIALGNSFNFTSEFLLKMNFYFSYTFSSWFTSVLLTIKLEGSIRSSISIGGDWTTFSRTITYVICVAYF